VSNDKTIKVEINDYFVCDSIYTLAVEYGVSVDFLLNLAIQRFIDDVKFFRQLRKSRGAG